MKTQYTRRGKRMTGQTAALDSTIKKKGKEHAHLLESCTICWISRPRTDGHTMRSR